MPIPVKFERFLNQDGTLKIDDYCEILNLRVPFTDLDVKSAYKPLALEYHPDKNRDCPYAITVFQAIADAKDKLLDPSTCQLYLRSLRELGVGRAGAGASADRASATYAPRSAAAAPPASAAPAQSARSTKPSRFTSAEPKSSPPPSATFLRLFCCLGYFFYSYFEDTAGRSGFRRCSGGKWPCA